MPRIVVEVGPSQPRWDGPTQRYQQPGERIVLDHDDMEEFRRQVLLHSHHCVIVEGELPDFSAAKQPRFLDRVVAKAKAAVATAPKEREFATLAEMREVDREAEREAKAAVRAAEEAASVDPAQCPDCATRFKNAAALARHFQRSGHGPKAEEAPE